jgi:hypothetical protein
VVSAAERNLDGIMTETSYAGSGQADRWTNDIDRTPRVEVSRCSFVAPHSPTLAA